MARGLTFACGSGIVLSSLFLGACGLGSVGIVSSATGNGGSTVTVQPTKLEVLAPAETASGAIPFRLGLQLDTRGSVRLGKIEYSLRGPRGPFQAATPVGAFPNEVVTGQRITGNQLARRGGDDLCFVWNASHDLGTQQSLGRIAFPVTASAMFRVALRDESSGVDIVSTTGEFVLDGRRVSSVAGGGVGDGTKPHEVCLQAPSGIASDGAGRLIIADTKNHRVRRVDFDTSGVPVMVRTIVGNGFRGIEAGLRPARATSASFPVAAAIDARGTVYFNEIERDADGAAVRGLVRSLDPLTGLVSPVVDGALLSRAFREPLAVVAGDSDVLWVAVQDEIWRIDVAVTPVEDSAITVLAGFEAPTDLALANEAGVDVLYVVERGAARVRRLRGGLRDSVVGGGTLVPTDGLGGGVRGTELLLFEPTGVTSTERHLFVCDRGRLPGVPPFLVVIEKANGTVVNVVQDARLKTPAGLAVTPDGTLFIVEEGTDATGVTDSLVLQLRDPEIPTSVAAAMVGEDSMQSESQGIDGTSMEQQSGLVTRDPDFG